MIILDTNIIAEMMKCSPAKQVANWLDQQDAAEIFITTVTVAEISYGLHGILDSARRSFLQKSFHKLLQASFKHRIFSFDEAASQTYGKLMQHRIQLGQPMSVLNGQIAAIALVNEAILATRNIHEFSHCEIDLVNPFVALETVEFEGDFDLTAQVE